MLRGSPGQSIVDALASCAKERGNVLPVLLVVTNPVEATVTWLAELTEWDRSRIMGLGTTVETARFSRFLADTLNVDATSVWTEIIGEHGDAIGVRDEAALERRVRELAGGTVNLPALIGRTRGAAAEIRMLSEAVGKGQADWLVERLTKRLGDQVMVTGLATALREGLAAALSPPATRFAIGAAVVEVVEAVGSDRGRVLPVSGFPNFPDAPNVALAVPSWSGGVASQRAPSTGLPTCCTGRRRALPSKSTRCARQTRAPRAQTLRESRPLSLRAGAVPCH